MTDEYPMELVPLLARFDAGWPTVIDVGPGWYPLLVELNEDLARIAPAYLVQQVKSKFGALAFHSSFSSDPYEYVEEFREAIDAAEWRSMKICEECGDPASQQAIGSWIWTVCPRHAREKAARLAE